MQEEVESRTVNLAISTTKLTMRTIVHAGMMYLRHRKLVKDLKKNEVPSGKQSVQDLIGQKQGVSSIDLAKTDLRGFEGVARKCMKIKKTLIKLLPYIIVGLVCTNLGEAWRLAEGFGKAIVLNPGEGASEDAAAAVFRAHGFTRNGNRYEKMQ